MAKIVHPRTPVEYLKQLIKALTFKTNIRGEISWVQQVRIIAELHSKFQGARLQQEIRRNGNVSHIKDLSAINKKVKVHKHVAPKVLNRVETELEKGGSNKTIPFTFIYKLAIKYPDDEQVQQKILDRFLEEKPTQDEYEYFFDMLKEELENAKSNPTKVGEVAEVPQMNDEVSVIPPHKSPETDFVLPLDDEEENKSHDDDADAAVLYSGSLNLGSWNCLAFISEKDGKAELFLPLSVINSKKKNEIKDLYVQFKKSNIKECGNFQVI
jgi:hypothetical protein